MSESSDVIDTGPRDGEEDVESPLKKQKQRHFTEGHDQSRRDVMSESESRAGLKDFLDAPNLKAPDPICCFHKLDQASHCNKHYLADNMEATRLGTAMMPQSARPKHNIAESNPRTGLFEKRLTSTDVKKRLGVSTKHAEESFPPLWTPEGTYKEVMLKISDAQNKNWQMKLCFSTTNNVYMIRGDWRKFVTNHHLVAGDLIIFDKPDDPLADNNHFSIQCVKGENSWNDQPGRPGNEPKPVTETRGLSIRLFGKDIHTDRV